MRLALFAIFIIALAVFPLLNLDNNLPHSKLSTEAIAATPVEDGSQPVTIKGSISYIQRIALPPESTITLSVKEGNTDNTAFEQTYALNGKQVPIEFTFSVPIAALKAGTAYYFQGNISVNGKAAWVSEKINFDNTKSTQNLGKLIAQAVIEKATTLTYQCGSEQLNFVSFSDKNELHVNGKIFEMIPVPAASGAKYQSSRGESTTFWSKGDTAQVKLENMALDECQKIVLPQNNQNAALTDLIIGNEWQLVKLNGDDVIGESKITLTLNQEGRVHGRSGCNSYSGTYTLKNDKIEISKAIVSTMMACIFPGVMEQESRYTSLLTDISSIKLQEDGNLIASTEDGRILVFGKN